MTFDVEKRFADHEEFLKTLYAKPAPAEAAKHQAEETLARANAVEAVWTKVEATTRHAPLHDRFDVSKQVMWEALQDASPELRADLLNTALLEQLHEILPPRAPGQLFRACENTVGRTRVLGTTLAANQEEAQHWPEAASLLKEFGPKTPAIAPENVRESRNGHGQQER